jgi:DUF971 family protein
MTSEPGQITVDHNRRVLTIAWRDAHLSALDFNLLRKQCPCAVCVEERKAPPSPLKLMSGPIITQAELTRVEPVGRYALSLAFNDGHDTGIYTYEFLRGLCPCPACSAAPAKA